MSFNQSILPSQNPQHIRSQNFHEYPNHLYSRYNENADRYNNLPIMTGLSSNRPGPPSSLEPENGPSFNNESNSYQQFLFNNNSMIFPMNEKNSYSNNNSSWSDNNFYDRSTQNNSNSFAQPSNWKAPTQWDNNNNNYLSNYQMNESNINDDIAADLIGGKLLDNITDENIINNNILKENSIPSNILNENSIPSNILNENSIPSNILNENSIPSNILNENSIPSNILNENSIPSNILNDSTNALPSGLLDDSVEYTPPEEPKYSNFNNHEDIFTENYHQQQIKTTERPSNNNEETKNHSQIEKHHEKPNSYRGRNLIRGRGIHHHNWNKKQHQNILSNSTVGTHGYVPLNLPQNYNFHHYMIPSVLPYVNNQNMNRPRNDRKIKDRTKLNENENKKQIRVNPSTNTQSITNPSTPEPNLNQNLKKETEPVKKQMTRSNSEPSLPSSLKSSYDVLAVDEVEDDNELSDSSTSSLHSSQSFNTNVKKDTHYDEKEDKEITDLNIQFENFGKSKNRDLWLYNEYEEKMKIKEFWLGLSEEERRALVKVEKDAILGKMKEQQKHICSCSVCGRRRSVMEEELEMLYDAYYDELQMVCTQGEGTVSDPSKSLTVRNGVMTVADDLLHNEGKKFLEMMEKLAERRIRKSEEQADNENNNDEIQKIKSNSPTMFDDDDNEVEEYDDEYSEDEEILTEEQRLIEGRRMFQLFAAKMFEQRVLNAFREKMALEKQEALIEEEEEEKAIIERRKMKKKQKKRQTKQKKHLRKKK